MKEQLATSGKVMAALAVLEGESQPSELFCYGPEEQAEALTYYAGVLKSRFARGKTRDLAELLRSWTERSPALPIQEIHPGWVFEVLRGESPRVIGLACRYLPGSHVRYLIERLPHQVRTKLPTLSESFGLPSELVEQAKRYLDQKFFPGLSPNPDEPFSCRHIPWMSAQDMRRVIRELGYEEIRNAFFGVGAKAARAFLTRFPIDEAKEIRRRLEAGPPISDLAHKRAQEHIVAMNLEVARVEDLPFEIGLSILAEAVTPDERTWIDGVIVRLSPSEGYSLRRFAQDALSKRNATLAERRQSQLLSLVGELAELGKIPQYWRLAEEEATSASETDE